MNAPRPARAAEKPWVQRHWILLLIAALTVSIALSAAVGLGVMYTFMSTMKDSEPYREAMRRAQADPRAIAALGQPIEPTGTILGAVEQKDGGTAQLFIFIRGPRGEADVQVEGSYRERAWDYRVMQIDVDGSGERIDLLEGGEPGMENGES